MCLKPIRLRTNEITLFISLRGNKTKGQRTGSYFYSPS
uniref:Uncharacterized protein n=1 Tax=Rhizophora mucronata TaxID=61149 RepID=A0A2P2R4J2_RHIMU